MISEGRAAYAQVSPKKMAGEFFGGRHDDIAGSARKAAKVPVGVRASPAAKCRVRRGGAAGAGSGRHTSIGRRAVVESPWATTGLRSGFAVGGLVALAGVALGTAIRGLRVTR